MHIIISLIAGLVFGLGLVISGMSNPSKVLNFLDLFGAFDPSLIFVMAGGIMTTFIGYRLVWRTGKPLLSGEYQKSVTLPVDGRLVAGAAIFGIGWGLVGLCPGPALTSLSFGALSALIFVAAMLIGMAVQRVVGMFF